MDEYAGWQDALETVASSYGIDLNQYNVSYMEDSGAAVLNTSAPINYSALRAGNYPGATLMERRRKDGSVSSQQFRNSAGEFGRTLNDKLRVDMRQVLVACFLENFDKEVHQETGQLRKAVQSGELTDTSKDLIGFTFKIADLPGLSRPGRNGKDSQRPSTGYYGPIVFQGRGPIITPLKSMRFIYKDKRFATKYVGPAAARDIFELSKEQIEMISKVALRPITEEAMLRIKSALEDKPVGD